MRRVGGVSRSVIREGKWDCSSCGSKDIPGGQKFCPSCGASRDQKEKISRNPDAPEITAKTILQEAMSGPEWNCEHCGSANSNRSDVCKTCSAPRGSSPHRSTGRILAQPETDEEVAISKTTFHEPTSQFGIKSVLPLVGAAALILAVLFSVYFFFIQTKSSPARVAGFSWERSINVEQLNTYQGEGWDPPTGARVQNSAYLPHGSKSVFDHYEDVEVQVSYEVKVGEEYCGSTNLDNGYIQDDYCDVFETRYRTEIESEPVYVTVVIYDFYYWYEYDQWDLDHAVKTEGADQSPFWGDVSLSSNQRKGGTSQKYTLIFLDRDGKKKSFSTSDESYWQSFREGQKVTLKINRVGDILEIQK